MQYQQRGFTIVEVVISLALVATLVLALQESWSIVNNLFFQLELRQKAYFILNNEMERLSILSREERLGDQSQELKTINKNGKIREIYDLEITRPTFVLSDGNEFIKDINAEAGKIFYLDDFEYDKNIVWLDKLNDIVGVLTFTRTNLDGIAISNSPDTDPKGNTPCYADFCKQVEVFFEFPYRLKNGSILEKLPNIEVTEVNLKSIVGIKNSID